MSRELDCILICQKLSLFIVEIMDEKTYRSIVQATQADTAEKISARESRGDREPYGA